MIFSENRFPLFRIMLYTAAKVQLRDAPFSAHRNRARNNCPKFLRGLLKWQAVVSAFPRMFAAAFCREKT
jgi:hypothetical protein